MSEEEERKRSSLSKFLSLLLRHNPGLLDLHLDNEGWLNCKIDELAERIKHSKDRLEWVTVDEIRQVVDTDPKGRYEINDQGMIRATYGHSIRLHPLDFPDEADSLPEYVYYAGSNFELDTMFRLGLIPRERRDRQYLHLSVEMKDAYSVAKNYTRYPRLIRIKIQDACESGIKFKQVSKFIVISEEVPPEFLEEIDLPEELQYLIHEKPQKFKNRNFKGNRRFSGKGHPQGHGPGGNRNDRQGFRRDRNDRRFGDRNNRFGNKPHYNNRRQQSDYSSESTDNNLDFDDDDSSIADQFNEIEDIKKKAKSKSTIHFETDDDFDLNQD